MDLSSIRGLLLILSAAKLKPAAKMSKKAAKFSLYPIPGRNKMKNIVINYRQSGA
jgi:hypothetical protein